MKDIKQFLQKIGKGEEEIVEEYRNHEPTPTGYPKPIGRYRLYYEGFNVSVEEPYYWTLEFMRYFLGFAKIDKLTDIFTASEQSSFFGAAQQRLGAQQEKVSQFLATVGKMVKELFQLVRELRVLDERLSYYHDSFTTSPSSESAEITLKGIWVDMVEQGAKNPASVYGMAREVQFTTLPDLFFSTHPKKSEDVDIVVERERAQFNRKVREVLKRKLRSFLAWKEHTFNEVKNRRVFTLKYLRQHYEIIRMYITWVKPYLKNVQRLQLDQKGVETPDIVVAFETSLIEVEVLAKKPMGKANACILANFWFRTRPQLSYQQEYQRGPLHVGRIQMSWRSYSWTDEEIETYKHMRAQEDFELLGTIDESVKIAMESLGDELMRYLKEAGEDVDAKEKEEEHLKKGPYKSVIQGFTGMFSSKKRPKHAEPKLNRKLAFQIEKDKRKASAWVKIGMWRMYDYFKKQHDMLSWT